MATWKRTTAGLLLWTPAPVHRSPPGSVVWEDVWEDEEQTEKDDDFVSHMDENGIIGLSDALKDMELETCGGNLIGSLKAWTEDEDGRQREGERGAQGLPERDQYVNMTEEEEGGLEAGLTGISISNSGTELHLQPLVFNHHCPISQPFSPATAPALSCLLQETPAAPGIEAEALPEMSLTESLPESHKSHTSLKPSPRGPGTTLGAPPQPAAMFSEKVIEVKHLKRAIPSLRKRRQCSPEARHSSSLSTAGTDSSECRSQTTGPGREQRMPGARSKAAGLDESRPLSHPIPDFSKVGPRVRFPKGGYKPPESRRSSRGEFLPPGPPLVFTSPADIVKEVLLNVPHGSPATSDPCRPAAGAAVFTVPQEFRCRQHAITLLEQLQEDYNTLLTKYAEAENTIDRLRLEAKVNLYSDPPKPGHTLQSELKQEASRLMMLDFPQAQRAEISSASPHANALSTHQESSPVSTTSPDPQVGQPAKILYSQAEQFLQQLQTFEDLLEQKTLKPVQRVKGLLQLAEALDSLESGYLLARDEQKPLQQGGAQMSHFDPERELEGLIFQFGQHMGELREQVGQTQQDPPTCEAPPSPHPHQTPSPVPSECGEAQAQPQNSTEPSLVDPGEAAGVEVSSTSEELEEETENGETENSLTLEPLNGKHRRDEDSATRADQYQSFRELHKRSNHSQKDDTPPPAAFRADRQPGREERERRSQRTGKLEVQRGLPQRKSDREDSPPPCTRGQRAHRSSPVSHRASSQSTTVPDDPPTSKRKFKVRPSHSSSRSSLGEITASERRNSTLQTGSSRALSQEGIISPEIDSGFIGSESSRLTPAAAPSPLHQRASESVLAPQEGNPVKPGTDPVSAPSPASSLSHRHTAVEDSMGSQLSPDQPRRSRRVRRRRTSSCSPQRRVGQTDRSRPDCGISGFKMKTDSSDSEGGQNESVDSLHSSSLSSFLDSPRHGRARGSSHVTYHNDAIQMLQDEVMRLKEKLESCLRNTTPHNSVRSAQTNHPLNRTSTARIRSRERFRDISRGRGDEEDTMRQAAMERPPSPHRQNPQPNIMTVSEPTVPWPKPLVSRCTQTSTAVSDGSCTHVDAVHRRAHTRQNPVQVCEAADEPDSGGRPVRLCPQCLSRQRWQPEAGGNKETTRSCLHCCPVYRCPEPQRGTESGSPTNTSRQPAQSPDGGMRRPFAAGAPPALLRCMSVSAPPLLLYSLPLCVSPSNNTVPSSAVRGRKETRRRSRRSRSTDEQRFVDDSLDRAIRAARHMSLTSRHMARSLAAGLNQSCG